MATLHQYDSSIINVNHSGRWVTQDPVLQILYSSHHMHVSSCVTFRRLLATNCII